MFNLLRSDLYRLRKNKVFKMNLILLTVGIIALNFLFTSKDNILIINRAHINGRNYGFIMGDIVGNENYIKFFESSLGLTVFIALAMLFFVGDMVIGRYQKGTLKNTLAYGHSRIKVYLSNIITLFIGVIGMSLFSFLFSMINLTLIFKPKGGISSNEVFFIIKTLGAWIIILCAMTSIYTLIATIIRSKAIVTTFGALYMTFISALIIEGFGKYLFTISPTFMLLDLCGKPINNPLMGTLVVNSIIIIIITNLLGCIVFSKQEIK